MNITRYRYKFNTYKSDLEVINKKFIVQKTYSSKNLEFKKLRIQKLTIKRRHKLKTETYIITHCKLQHIASYKLKLTITNYTFNVTNQDINSF